MKLSCHPAGPRPGECDLCTRYVAWKAEQPEPTPAAAGPYRWVSTADLVRDSVRLAGLLPPDTGGVVGIPRSGMIPASVIASHLHLPLWELTRDGGIRRMGHGSRGETFGFPGSAGPLAVVDDSVFGGNEMRRARSVLAGVPAVFAAVYVLPDRAGVVDAFAAGLPDPHLMEWNLFNCHWISGGDGVATDLDGVVLHDAESGGKIGTPYLVPRAAPVPLIVTGRPERERMVTVRALKAAGARWSRLEMLPAGGEMTTKGFAAHKARHYAESGCGFFCESSPEQAEEIAKLSGRPVICPRAGKVY